MIAFPDDLRTVKEKVAAGEYDAEAILDVVAGLILEELDEDEEAEP